MAGHFPKVGLTPLIAQKPLCPMPVVVWSTTHTLRSGVAGYTNPDQKGNALSMPCRTHFHLMQGDAFKLLPNLEPESVDALIADPPYCSGGLFASDRAKDPVSKYEQSGQKHSKATFAGDQKDQRSWTRWTSEWLRECYRLLRPGAPFAVFIDWRQLPAMSDAVQMADLVWRGVAVWDKTERTRPVRGRPRNQCEYVVWGSKGPMPIERNTKILPGLHRELVLQSDKHHLTGKPVGVMRWLCELAEPGSLILDPFAGSGSTGVAALLAGYRFIGIERDSYYHGVARQRLEAASRGVILSAAETIGPSAPGA